MCDLKLKMTDEEGERVEVCDVSKSRGARSNVGNFREKIALDLELLHLYFYA